MVARIGLIGAGTFGEMHLQAYSQMGRREDVELAGVADVDAALLDKRQQEYGIATYLDYRQMLKEQELDAVAVATPDHLHAEISIDCLKAGKHVFVEKPLDTDVGGCQKMIEMAEANNCLLQVDFHKRFDPSYLELRSLIRQGHLGDFEYGYAHIENRLEVPLNWLGSWVEQTSPNWFLGVHMYDLVRFVTGDKVSGVAATGIKNKLASLGIDTFDSIQSKLILSGGGSFSVDTSWILPDGHEAIVNQGFRLVGSEGMMELDSQYRGVRGCLKKPTDSRTSEKSAMQTWNLEFFRERQDAKGQSVYGGYGIESIQDFVSNVNELLEGVPLTDLKGQYADGYDGLEATKIAAAVEASVQSKGQLVRL